VVSDEAVAVGVSAVPTPVTQLGSDLWFAHKYMMCSGSAVNDGVVGCPFSLDSKAMRKVDVGQDLVVVLERGDVGDGWTVIIGGRMLVKLH